MKMVIVGLVLCCSYSAVEAMPATRASSERSAAPIVNAEIIIKKKIVRKPAVVHKKVVKKVVVH